MSPDRVHPAEAHVGARLQRLRVSKRRTQSDLAKAIGVTFQQVQKYESGANRISASRLWLIAAYLETPVEWFFEGLGEASAAATPPRENRRQAEAVARAAAALSPERQRLVVQLIRALADNEPAEDAKPVLKEAV